MTCFFCHWPLNSPPWDIKHFKYEGVAVHAHLVCWEDFSRGGEDETGGKEDPVSQMLNAIQSCISEKERQREA